MKEWRGRVKKKKKVLENVLERERKSAASEVIYL